MEKSHGDWHQFAKINPSDGFDDDFFGFQVALANNTIFVYTSRTHCARGGAGCSVSKRFVDSKRMAESVYIYRIDRICPGGTWRTLPGSDEGGCQTCPADTFSPGCWDDCRTCPTGTLAESGATRVISDCHFAVQLNHFIPGLLSYLVPVF